MSPPLPSFDIARVPVSRRSLLAGAVLGGGALAVGAVAVLGSSGAFAAAALQRYVDAVRSPSVDALIARPDLTEPLRKTITTIVSAWYLGIVGDDERTELVSYAQALMYRPTQDVLVIPTYGGGPGSWGEKPVDPTSTTETPR